MLKQFKSGSLRPLATAMLAAATLAGVGHAWATTAADTTLRNTVTVNYSDAAANPQTALTASVDVTVNLVRSNPILSAPADISTDPATSAVYAYTITNAANGIETFNMTEPLSQSAGISGSTATSSLGTITLGATTVASATTIAASGTTTITVPRDNTNDGKINGLSTNDYVVINGQVFQIAGIGADTASPGTTTITVNGNGTALAVAAGTLIAQRVNFTVTVKPGTVSNATTDQTITTTTTATDPVVNTFTSNDVTVTTVLSVGLTVQKLVRNTNYGAGAGGNAAGTGAVSYNGSTYYAGGVTGNPTEVLEYLIIVTKNASTSSATQVKISDPIPPFTTYVGGSMTLQNNAGGVVALNDSGSNGDAGETDGLTVYFYPGTGGSDLPGTGVNDGTGGTMGANAVSYATFRVSIN
ncbi:MAG TPA: hypothetical protein VFM34_05765 [Moraxellaceae bacterium]|nr:hypothetical protein [Moraxellaceae bacterium]